MPVDPVKAELADGAGLLNGILAEHFMDNPRIMIISSEQHEALAGDLSGSRIQIIRGIADKLGSDATLIVTLHSLRQREGDKYSSDTPTSLAFKYHLIRSADGQAVCTGSFDETQEALTDNILKLKSAIKRGFKWISVEDLAREAFKSKFASCPALSRKEAK